MMFPNEQADTARLRLDVPIYQDTPQACFVG